MRGLASRIGLLLIGAMLLILVIAGAMILASGRNVLSETTLPLPQRVAAIVNLIEIAPPANLKDVVAALNAPDISVSVLKQVPSPAPSRDMPGMTAVLKAYLGVMDGRPVRVMRDLSAGGQAGSRLLQWAGRRFAAAYPVKLVIGLRDGRTLVIETRDPLAEQFTGLRFSLFALSAAVIIGAAAIVILRNQIGPLERLADAVERFGENRVISEIPESGAREVRLLIAAFNRLQSQIASLIAQRTRMVAAIGHDLGTYLTRLRLRADYIADSDQRERAVRDIEDVHALLTDTLALAKLDHDGEAVEETDLVALARRSVARLGDSESRVRLTSETAGLIAPVRPSAMSRLFDNLISNALKYGNDCEVTLSRNAGAAQILVDDHGPGIPADERAAVLEPFYRRDASRNLDEPGFGLGLAIVADIVQRHAGTLCLEDRPGGGLRVRVLLPLAADRIKPGPARPRIQAPQATP